MESAACSLLAGPKHGSAAVRPRTFTRRRRTRCGALLRYITTPTKDFQPISANIEPSARA